MNQRQDGKIQSGWTGQSLLDQSEMLIVYMLVWQVDHYWNDVRSSLEQSEILIEYIQQVYWESRILVQIMSFNQRYTYIPEKFKS